MVIRSRNHMHAITQCVTTKRLSRWFTTPSPVPSILPWLRSIISTGFLSCRHLKSREDLPAQAPRALEPPEQKRFLRAVERCSSVRDRAIALLLFYTGLRISECAALTLNDVRLSSRKGLVMVRMGKGNTYREVPLNAEVRTALDAWLEQRKKQIAPPNES